MSSVTFGKGATFHHADGTVTRLPPGQYGNVINGKPEVKYPIYYDKDTPEFWDKYEICPECKEKFEMQCKCRRSGRTCANGHEWHLHNLEDGRRAVGPGPGHGKDSVPCDICDGKDV